MLIIISNFLGISTGTGTGMVQPSEGMVRFVFHLRDINAKILMIITARPTVRKEKK